MKNLVNIAFFFILCNGIFSAFSLFKSKLKIKIKSKSDYLNNCSSDLFNCKIDLPEYNSIENFLPNSKSNNKIFNFTFFDFDNIHSKISNHSSIEFIFDEIDKLDKLPFILFNQTEIFMPRELFINFSSNKTINGKRADIEFVLILEENRDKRRKIIFSFFAVIDSFLSEYFSNDFYGSLLSKNKILKFSELFNFLKKKQNFAFFELSKEYIELLTNCSNSSLIYLISYDYFPIHLNFYESLKNYYQNTQHFNLNTQNVLEISKELLEEVKFYKTNKNFEFIQNLSNIQLNNNNNKEEIINNIFFEENLIERHDKQLDIQ